MSYDSRNIMKALEAFPIGSRVCVRLPHAPQMCVVDVYVNEDDEVVGQRVYVECVWFSTENRLQREDFDVECIVAVENQPQPQPDYMDRLMREREAPTGGASPHADQG